MGFFAATVDGSDTQPVEDFSVPPAPNSPRATLTGVVTDVDSGRPVAGAAVTFGGHSSGFAGSYAAVTDANGKYQIKNIFVGTYQKVSAGGSGFERQVKTVPIAKGTNTVNWVIRRDWAAAQGGASVADFNGEDNTIFGCGPGSMIDLSQGNGWSSDAVYTSPTAMDPRFITVHLPAAVNITQLTINPTGNCGDDPSASTGDYRVETSSDGNTWTVAASGHFGVANRDTANTVPLTAGTTGVTFVRYTMLGTQVADEGGTCPGDLSGCDFVDSVELAVYGAPAS
jgi:extracellular elastinolytic metalloproteinase